MDDDAAELIEGPAAIVLCTVDADGRAIITRAWGVQIGDGRRDITICVATSGVPRMRESLERLGEVALNFTIPTSYRGIQVKGTVLEAGEPSPEDLARLHAQFSSFCRTAVAVGMTERGVRRLLLGPDFLRIRLAVRELYDQTPGPAAGVTW
jgi:pyridoxamine 5'-phosphate oxidase-like protein